MGQNAAKGSDGLLIKNKNKKIPVLLILLVLLLFWDKGHDNLLWNMYTYIYIAAM